MTTPTASPPGSSTTGPQSRRLLTFGSGGWVLCLAGVVCVALMAWALAPVVLGTASRSPGDGRTLESYRFDLGNLLVPRHLIMPAMLHRDMVRTIDEPNVLSQADLAAGRKFLVPADRVVGVRLGNKARAYPLSVLNVHEIVHDTLGGVPIAVTYSWPCDSAVVFDRRVEGRPRHFGVSGLLYNSNLLMYDRPAPAGGAAASDPEPGGESLWSQMLGRAVSGPAAARGLALEQIPAVLTDWSTWRERHPETTVVGRDPTIVARRYKKADPDPYFQGGRVMYPVEPAPPAEAGLPPLERVVAVGIGAARRVYPLPLITERATRDGRWSDALGGHEVVFDYAVRSRTVTVRAETADLDVDWALWFAWHAFHPDDPLAE